MVVVGVNLYRLPNAAEGRRIEGTMTKTQWFFRSSQIVICLLVSGASFLVAQDVVNWVDQRGVTADAAIDLAEVLGTSSKLWMNLQATYDLDRALSRRKKVA